MREEWKTRKKRYWEIYVAAVNIKSREILSMMKVTNEHVHDSKALPELVEKITKSNMTAVIDKLFSDDNA